MRGQPFLHSCFASQRAARLERQDAQGPPDQAIYAGFVTTAEVPHNAAHRPDGSPWGDIAESMHRLFTDSNLNSAGTKQQRWHEAP